MRWEAGHADARRAIERKLWQGDFDALEGVILHENADDMPTPEPAIPSAPTAWALRELASNGRALNTG
jgi:hypothetical protein